MRFEFLDPDGFGYVECKDLTEFDCLVDQVAGEYIEAICMFNGWRKELDSFWDEVLKGGENE